ncbi:MAG: YceH family protein [Pseudomonadota bacterium]
MAVVLDEVEQRVLGCLLEKAVITPEQYPLTLNSLVNACNQKSSRAPVMQLEPGQVQSGLRRLEDMHLIRSDENFKSRVEKFTHRFCNTPFSDYQFDPAQYAVVTVLLLRGPRTPGEIRANSGRLHTFADNDEVEATLASLVSIEKGPVVTQLPRAPGRRDAEWRHLFDGREADAPTAPTTTAPTTGAPTTPVAPTAGSSAQNQAPGGGPAMPATDVSTSVERPDQFAAAAVEDTAVDDLSQRVADLEAQVSRLAQQLAALQAELGL